MALWCRSGYWSVFEHRKEWIQDRLRELSGILSIVNHSFNVMLNHVHVILRNRPDGVATWSDAEVARRWWQLFPKRRNEDGTAAEPNEFELHAYAAKAIPLKLVFQRTFRFGMCG